MRIVVFTAAPREAESPRDMLALVHSRMNINEQGQRQDHPLAFVHAIMTLMSKGKDKTAELAKEGTAAATGIAVAVATGTSSLLAGFTAAPVLVGVAVQAIIRRNQARLDRWFVELSRRLGDEPDAVRNKIEAKMVDHGGAEVAATVLAAVDRLMRAVDDAVVPCLAALTAEYVRDERRPDTFFRGTARLLEDIDALELRSLRDLVSHLATATGEHLEVVLIQRSHIDPSRPVELEIKAHIDRTSPIDPLYVPAPADTIRLFHLLKSVELGWDAAAGFMDSSSGPAVLRTQRSIMQKLHAIIRVTS